MSTPHNIDEQAMELARELTLIATNYSYGDLRRDMVTHTLTRELDKQPSPWRSILAALTVQYLCIAIEALADEVGEVA